MSDSPQLAILSYGAACPLGLSGPAIGAACYTNLDDFRLYPRIDGKQTATLEPDEPPADDYKCSKLTDMDLGEERGDRILRLASLALEDCQRNLTQLRLTSLPWFIALPNTLAPEERGQIIPAFLSLSGRSATDRNAPAFLFGDRGSFGMLLEQAYVRLEQSGTAAALLMAADSMVSRPTLESLDGAERLLGPTNPDGLIPGEGAGAFVMTRRLTPRDKPLATVNCWSHALCSGDPEHYHDLAATYTEALQGLLKTPSASGSRVDRFLFDGSGEGRFARAASIGYLRCHELFPEPFNMDNMASSLGDVGAAAQCMQLVRTLYGVTRGWKAGLRDGRFLLSAIGDDGAASALLVTRGHGL